MALSKFGSAFAAARKAGDKTFEFNGKKFTTETKDDQKAAAKKSKAAPEVGGGRGGRGGPTVGELEKFAKSKQGKFQAAQAAAQTAEGKGAREQQTQKQALEGVYPEMMLGGAGLMKTAASATRVGAKAAPQVASKVADKAKTLVAKDRRMAEIPSRRAANAQQAKENIAKYQPKERPGAGSVSRSGSRSGPGSGSGAKAVTKSRTKFKDDEVGVEFKRGGSVRGDGCVTSGKTKGRMR